MVWCAHIPSIPVVDLIETARFNDSDRDILVFGQACSDGQSSGTAADDDVIVRSVQAWIAESVSVRVEAVKAQRRVDREGQNREQSVHGGRLRIEITDARDQNVQNKRRSPPMLNVYIHLRLYTCHYSRTPA